ncbi:response regulator transcription factor [Serratia ureilytica]|uniref:response regulator transcription factor n=2 Tax=Serratia ureilytica TaxID=300181 RepID=UPI001867B013|nr:response regulator transcription factor [Serratia ureilytica]UMK53608.1 hypothetical protein L2D49_04495 [Serratia ureilytica]
MGRINVVGMNACAVDAVLSLVDEFKQSGNYYGNSAVGVLDVVILDYGDLFDVGIMLQKIRVNKPTVVISRGILWNMLQKVMGCERAFFIHLALPIEALRYELNVALRLWAHGHKPFQPVAQSDNDVRYLILGKLLAGESPYAIAARLKVNVKYISHHKLKALNALGVRNCQELAPLLVRPPYEVQ